MAGRAGCVFRRNNVRPRWRRLLAAFAALAVPQNKLRHHSKFQLVVIDQDGVSGSRLARHR
jgi:hypothetical protein